jgi:hypothetical protein
MKFQHYTPFMFSCSLSLLSLGSTKAMDALLSDIPKAEEEQHYRLSGKQISTIQTFYTQLKRSNANGTRCLQNFVRKNGTLSSTIYSRVTQALEQVTPGVILMFGPLNADDANLLRYTVLKYFAGHLKPAGAASFAEQRSQDAGRRSGRQQKNRLHIGSHRG